MRRLYLVVALCALLLCGVSAEVQVASKDNFDKVVSGEITLVKFYAPWCGHCKTLAPEFEKAADMLSGVATLAKVDCTQEEELAKKYEIKGFPTLYVFRNGEKVMDYSGPRNAEGITSFMKALASPLIVEIEKSEDLEELKKQDLPVCVVKTASSTSEIASLVARVGDTFRMDMRFALVKDASILPEDAMESLTVYRKGSEREAYTGSIPMTSDDLTSFLSLASIDYFGELNSASFQKYMKLNALRPLGWVFVDKNTDATLKESLVAVGKKFRSQVLLTFIDGDQYRAVSLQLGVPKDTPFPVLVVDYERKHHIMPLDTPVTSESVSDFIEKYLKGETVQVLMTEPIPEKETVDGLTTVVGDTLEKYTDGTRNVLLFFYAPWCGHCQKLHPVYEQLAKDLETEDVVIAKFDATKNDFDRTKFEVTGYPTLYFIPTGKEPITYEGARTAEDLAAFVKSHMIPSAAPSSKSANVDEADL